MNSKIQPRIKICCISSPEEAKIAIEFGASALGLVGEMPSGPGVISDELIADITKAVPPTIATFLLTSKTTADEIVAHHKCVNTSTIQLVDEVSIDTYAKIRISLPFVKIVQVIHVIDERSIENAIKVSENVDALLLDSGNPNLVVKELGGTGRTHNWKLSKKLREKVTVPIFLAGGITPENVKRAYETVKPFGIDLCSGVRTNGRLDMNKLEKFFAEVNSF